MLGMINNDFIGRIQVLICACHAMGRMLLVKLEGNVINKHALFALDLMFPTGPCAKKSSPGHRVYNIFFYIMASAVNNITNFIERMFVR
jgi:hypothetical protein